MTRVIIIVVVAALVLQAAVAHEALPWGDLEYMDGAEAGSEAWALWARAGEPCRATGWTIASGAVDGSVCVRGAVAGEEFALGGEGSGSPIVGSVMLRADGETEATVRLSWFNRLSRVDETMTANLSDEWQRFELTVRPDASGPLELAVAPASDEPIYADAFSITCPAGPPGEQVDDGDPIRHELPRLSGLQGHVERPADRRGTVELTVSAPGGWRSPMPCATGGIPLPEGELFVRNHARVTDRDGNPVPAQLDVLARWQDDDSIQVLLVTVPASAPRRLLLEYGPDVAPAEIEQSEPGSMPDMQTRPVVLGLDGTAYVSENEGSPVVERAGPLMAVVTQRMSAGPLTAEIRVMAFADSTKALVSTTFINEGDAIAVRGLGVRMNREGAGMVMMATGDGMMPLQGGQSLSWGIGPSRSGVRAWGCPPDSTPGGTLAAPRDGRVLTVAVRDFAENRPGGFTATPSEITAWAWPPEAGGVLLSQGIARTFDLLIDWNAQGPPVELRTAEMPIVLAPAGWYCDSGVFGFLMPPDPQTFPIFEQTLGSLETLGRFSWERKGSGNLFGLFNYGDAPGDGGWSNLETMADHELMLHFFRTLSREHFDNARLAAEHYRDVDIDHRFGFCHTHCNNHTSSGESWSHSWIQGIRDHYLLTGDARSLAVLREVGERLLQKEPGFTTGRDWTRAIDNLVDIYQATGDDRYLEATLAHIEVLRERQDPEAAICGAEKGSWYENRYSSGSAFTWYGCLAMAKLHRTVGGEELAETFLRELDLSLDVERKGKSAWIFPQDAEISEDRRAQEIGIYALGRGSVLFPALAHAYRITRDEEYLRLGMNVLAHCLLNQRGGSDASATSFITAFLREAKAAGYGPEQEREAFERAREFSWAQHPRELTNGGFEQPNFAHWDIKKPPGQDHYEDPVVNVGYYYDAEVAIEGERSLRIHSGNRTRYIRVNNQVALEGPRRWRLIGWVRADETMNPQIAYSLRSYDSDATAAGTLTDTGETRDGWTQRAAEFMTLGRMVLTVSLINSSGTGDAWFDGLRLEDLGPVGKLLSENGVGHEQREPDPALVIRTRGTYLPDAPMTGDVEIDGPIPFTAGSLTDGDDSYDYQRTPCSYAYWEHRRTGELLFDLRDTYRIERVALKVNNDPSRRAHGTKLVELLPAEGDEPIATLEPEHGWNAFEDLKLEAQKLRLRLHLMDDRTYLTVAEVQIWGDRIIH